MLEFKSERFEPFATILEESLAHMNLVRYKGDDRNVYSLYSLCKNSVYADKKMKQVNDHLHRICKLSQYSRYIPEVLGTLTNSGSLQIVYKTVLVCPLPELWSGNTLAKLNEFEAKFYVSCLICALETIHIKGITFRGMSSEKILIDHQGLPQLTDYKISKDNISRSFTICGTPDYMAPEVITNSGADYTVDWWAIGVLLHELMTGSLPFSNEKTTEFQLFEKISNYKHLGLKITGINQDCVDLIHAFLNPDSKVRLGHGGVEYGAARIKEMEWFKDVSWERIAAGREPSPHIEKVYTVLQDMKNGSTEISATHPEFTIDDVNWFKDW
jgi:serine/threonine protein kinase